jgi:hypothetical protein
VTGRAAAATATVESRASWAVALTALGIYAVSFGAPTITVVALKPIAAELGSARSVPALAFALARRADRHPLHRHRRRADDRRGAGIVEPRRR